MEELTSCGRNVVRSLCCVVNSVEQHSSNAAYLKLNARRDNLSAQPYTIYGPSPLIRAERTAGRRERGGRVKMQREDVFDLERERRS